MNRIQTLSPRIVTFNRLLFKVLDFLSPMAPLCFEPVAEAAHGVFSQYPATLPGESNLMPCVHLDPC